MVTDCRLGSGVKMAPDEEVDDAVAAAAAAALAAFLACFLDIGFDGSCNEK